VDDAEENKPHDLRDRLKAFAQPLVDSLDSKLRDQVDTRVDQRVDELVDERVDAALTARLAVIERAIADLDRSLKELQARLG
jgi:hypothetical protein